MMRGDHGPIRQLQDLNWGAFDHASHAPQLRSCNYNMCITILHYTTPISHMFTYILTHMHAAGSDYEPECSLFLMFPPGEMALTVNVSTLDDSVLERDEEFAAVLELSVGGGGVTLGRSVATATILNDDGNLRVIQLANP